MLESLRPSLPVHPLRQRSDPHARCWPVGGAGRPFGVSAAVAILVTMLVVRSGPQIAGPSGHQGTAIPAAAVARQQSRPAVVENGRRPEYQAATERSLRPVDGLGGEETSYLTLRDQVLQEGVESWRFPASSVVSTTKTKDTAEAPVTHQQQLSRLLEEQGLRGS